MKIAIVGAGFTGLAAAYKLSKQGVDVTIFEEEEKPGGLASGFKEKNWDWTLEKHYHHIFTSDWEIRKLAKEVGHKIVFSRPSTSILYSNEVLQFDSPISLLKFPHLSFLDKVRTGLTLFYLKYITSWEPLEEFTSEKFLKGFMGKQSWKVLWEPLFKAKFGKYSSKIPASWFWARIKKRSASLGYPEGGFQSLADKLSASIKQSGGKVSFREEVLKTERESKGFDIKTSQAKYKFDKVIFTLSAAAFVKITKGLSQNYQKKLLSLKSIGVVNLVLRLKKGLLKEGNYWLNINDTSFPFVAVVEHTNFISKKFYGNDRLVYLGNYLPHKHVHFKKSARSLFKVYLPYIKRINSKFDRSWVKDIYAFKDQFAQPIVSLNYSKNILKINTPIKNLFLANMQQVYPWDRGVNYAVKLGYKVADLVLQS